MARPRVTIEAPPVTPLPFGLFSAAQVVDDASPHWPLGFQYETDHCGPATVWSEDFCYQPATVPDLTVTVNAEGTGGTVTSAGPVPPGEYFINGPTITNTSEVHPGGVLTAPFVIVSQNITHNVAVSNDAADPLFWNADFVPVGGSLTVDGQQANVPRKDSTDGLAGLVEGDPFGVYHLLNCRMPGGGWQEGEERARNALRLGEQRAVEQALWSQFAADGDGEPLGSGYHPVDGVAVLEAWAAANYGGVPTLHIPRGATTVLSSFGTVGRYGTRLETVQGSLVASGGGYEGTTEASRIYVTGQTVVRRSPNIQVAPAPDLATNEFSALAERIYATTWECVLGYVDVYASHFTPTDGGPQ